MNPNHCYKTVKSIKDLCDKSTISKVRAFGWRSPELYNSVRLRDPNYLLIECSKKNGNNYVPLKILIQTTIAVLQKYGYKFATVAQIDKGDGRLRVFRWIYAQNMAGIKKSETIARRISQFSDRRHDRHKYPTMLAIDKYNKIMWIGIFYSPHTSHLSKPENVKKIEGMTDAKDLVKRLKGPE